MTTGGRMRIVPLSTLNGSCNGSAGTRSLISRCSRLMAARTRYRFPRSALPRCGSSSATTIRLVQPTGQIDASAGERHALVFTTRTGHPVEPRNINRAFDVRCTRYGVRRITLPRHSPYLRFAPGRARRSPANRDGHPPAQPDRAHDGDLHPGPRQGDQGRTSAAKRLARPRRGPGRRGPPMNCRCGQRCCTSLLLRHEAQLLYRRAAGRDGGDISGSDGRPDPKGEGDNSMPGNRRPCPGVRAVCRGIRVIWRKLDCLNPSLQKV